MNLYNKLIFFIFKNMLRLKKKSALKRRTKSKNKMYFINEIHVKKLTLSWDSKVE